MRSTSEGSSSLRLNGEEIKEWWSWSPLDRLFSWKEVEVELGYKLSEKPRITEGLSYI